MAEDIWGAAVDRRLATDGYVNMLDDRDPETVRRANVTGRQLGLPGSIVEADLPGFEKQAEGQRAKSLLEYAPGLAAYVSDANNAAAVKDDLPTVAEISRLLNIHATEQEGYTIGRGGIERVKQNLKSTSRLNPTGTQLRNPTYLKTNPTAISFLGTTVAVPVFQTIRMLGDVLTEDFSSSDLGQQYATAVARMQARNSPEFQPVGEFSLPGIDHKIPFNPKAMAFYGSSSLAQMLLTRGVVGRAGVLPGLSTISAAGEYNQVRNRGGSVNEAIIAAGATGGLEAITERMAVDYFFRNIGKEGAASFIKGVATREIPGEVAATITQNAVDALTTGGGGSEEYFKNLPRDIVDTIGSTLVMVGGSGALQLAAHRLSPEMRAMGDVERAAAGAAFLDKLMTRASESKTRQSDPETFREFVESQTADTPIRELYIPVEAINEYMQSEGYEAGALEAYSDQIAEAQATQGDVVIPVADAAAYLAGTPAWEALKDKVRLQPGGLSQKEALEQHAEIMAVLEQRGAEIAKEVDEQTATVSDATEVYLDVKNRMLATGVDPKVAEHTAQLVAARYEARGKRRGTTAKEQYEKSGVLFAGEQQGKVKGRSLSQPLVMGGVSFEVNNDGTYRVELTSGEDRRLVGAKMSIRDLRDRLGDELAARILAGDRAINNVDLTTRDGKLALRDRLEPMAGLPSRIKVDGLTRQFGPFKKARDAAARIAKALGIEHRVPQTYARVDEARATRIAQAFEEMRHDPNDPQVKAAYRAMIDETIVQYKELMKTGLKVEFIEGEDPYGNPRNAILDVVENNHLWVYPTSSGFGSSDADISGNPLLEPVPGIEISGKPVVANDLFRVVHDYFGHIMEGVGFRADGEENAWRIHSAMYSPLARRAMTTETRGQNSWVNFGPHGLANRTAGPADTVYADQKIGLLPDWVMTEGLEDRTLNQSAAIGGYEGLSVFLSDEEKANLKQRSKEKLLDIVRTLPDAKEVAAVAYAGRAKRGWYENSAQAILDVFGQKDAPRFAALLAALSPQTSVQSNLYNALKTWTNWNEAGRPTDRKTIVEIMGQSVEGNRGVASVLTAWINNSVAALSDPDPVSLNLSGPKVNSFFANLVGIVDEVTQDTWMANFMGANAMGLRGGKNSAGKGLTYKAMNAVVRAAADVLTRQTGELWTPAEVQETAWSLAKTVYEMRDTMGERRSMRQLLEAGHVTHDDIANTPDFAVLFSHGIYQTILEEAGYGEQTRSLGRNRRAVGVDGQASVAADIEGSGFSPDDFRSFLAATAERLEATRAERRGTGEPRQRELFQSDAMTSLPSGADTDPVGTRVLGYHGTPFDFDEFRPGKAVWFSEGRGLADRYADPRRFRKSGTGRVINAEISIQAPLDLDPALRSLPKHMVVENPVQWVQDTFGFDLKAQGWERQGQAYAHDIFRSEAFADAARAAGYDTLKMTEGGAQTWGVLDLRAIAQQDRELFQAETRPVFYSALLRALEQNQTKRATGAQWAATLRKLPGIKQEELEWTGLLEFLEANEGLIDRAALVELVDEGGIEVNEVMLGERHFTWQDMGFEIELMEDESGWVLSRDSEIIETFPNYDAAERYARTEAFEEDQGDAQFKSWSSDPSNDTYRELLITLPIGVAGNPTRAPSTHWDTEAVVAHTRFMDKTDADGKRVLFVEEVQSDWHQKGRDQGYETPVSEEEDEAARLKLHEAMERYHTVLDTAAQEGGTVFAEVVEARSGMLGSVDRDLEGPRAIAQRMFTGDIDEATTLRDAIGAERYLDLRAAYNETALRVNEARQGVYQLERREGIPNAPFKSSWPALVMKRLIRYAAENGYDRVAWTTGEEQAERYNLSEAVGALVNEGMHDSEGHLIRMQLRAAIVLAGNGHGQIVEQYRDQGTLRMTEGQMREAFGNDIAQRLIESDGEPLRGNDLRVGGEGMKAFYDRNLVNITNDIIKKYGAKVGPVDMTPEAAKKGVLDGIGYELDALTGMSRPRDAMGRGRIWTPEEIDKWIEGIKVKAEQAREDNPEIAAIHDRRVANQERMRDLAAQWWRIARGEEKVETNVNPGFDITDKMREAAMQGFTLFQRPSQPRGSTTFLSDGSRLIRLFETANESTLAHEFGHIWLEEMRADALGEDATDSEKADWDRLKKWWAKQGIVVTDEGEIPEAAHEFFARTFERYLREGRPPIRDLRSAFKAFATWLTRIYQQVRAMNAPINPELRGVFDRMLATEDAIDAYRAQENVGPLFNSAEEAGMTEAEFAAYSRLVVNARDDAYDTLLEKTMAAVRAKRRAAMREQRGNIRAQVAAEINGQPMFVGLHLLRTGRWLGDPQRERTDVKLNTGWLIDTFGEEILDQLPKGLPITHGAGVDGDTVAEMVGAASGTELVNALVGMRTASEALRAAGETRSLREKMIDDEVDRRMAERHGDVLNDGSIEEEAIAALNTATQGEVIAAEARQLAKRATKKQPLTPYQFAREWARRKVLAGRVNDTVSRSALQRYTRATAKSARLAEAAILEGNTDEAYRQKQAQLLNHALLAESKIAADQIDTIVARMKRLAGRAAMKSVDQDYMDKIHQLLEAYDFRERSQRSLDEQESFQDWAEKQRAMGFEVHIPPRLENRGDPYSRVTVEELMSLNDLVQSLIHIGRLKQKLKVAKEERDFNEFVDEVVARVEQLPQRDLSQRVGLLRKDRYGKSPINEDQRAGAGLASELVKVETLVEELDGGKTGPLHDVVVRGATEAENRRVQLRHDVLMPIVQAYHDMGRKAKKRLRDKVTIPELTWNTLNEGDPRQGRPVTVTRSELLSIALNMGNLSNLEKLSKGERWPVPTLQAVMDRELSKEDWDFVQMLWRQVDSLWTDIVATEREMSGVVPEKVVPVPIETRFGTYEGGYWPVVYDAARWQRAEDLEAAKLDDMFGIKSGVATQKGHTISRTQAFGPINLSLENVLFQHMEQVVTRIAYTAYARDVLRVIRNPRIRGIIDTRLGSEYRKQFEPWLGRVIHEGAVHAKAARWWQKVLKQARINMTVAAMGFRFSTGIAQTLGLTASAQRIGAVNVANGLRMVALSPRKSAEFAFARSAELRNRNGAANREISEVFGQLRGKHSMLTEAQAWAFWHIGMIDRYMVALPTWLGAHAKATREGMTDDEASAYADKEVRQSQGSGAEKDLASWQSPNNDAMRFFSMFYTPFNILFNEQWKGVRGLKKGQIAPIAGVTFWWLMVMTLADALMSGDAPDWDDEEGVVKWFGRNVFFSLFAGIPLIRDAATYVERKSIGEYAEFNANPITRIWDAVEKTYKMGDKYITEGEEPKRPIKQVADVTAILTGVPVSQAGTSGQFLWDYHEGEADPQSVSDWYFGVTRGKVPAAETE